MLTNLLFLSSTGTYRPVHCWFQRLGREADIAAGDIASGPFLAAAIKSLCKPETERQEQKSDFL